MSRIQDGRTIPYTIHIVNFSAPRRKLIIELDGTHDIKGELQLMSVLFPDTHPKMEALQIQLWRQASPTRKMQMVAQLNQSARLLALTGLRSQFPNASEAELRRRLADLLLGNELANKVYGEAGHAK